MNTISYPSQVKKLRHELLTLVTRIRESMPFEQVSPNKAKAKEEWEGFFEGHCMRRVIIYLRSSGCAWAIKPAGSPGGTFKPGCFDCSHSVAGTTRGVPVTADSYIQQFLTEYEDTDFTRSPILCLYNEGSFFNEAELPSDARRQILKIIAADRRIRGLVLESLPEYLGDEALLETRNILSSKYLEIGIGLESVDQFVRDFCVNKSYSLYQYEQAAKLVKQYAHLLAYVLLKPSFLTEKEALKDSLKTVDYAFRTGADVISLEPVNTGEYNLCGVLSRLGVYRVPWLWTVLEVAKAAHQCGEVRIGGSQFAPQYENSTHNCTQCTERILHAIKMYNSTNDLHLLEDFACNCKAVWQAELQRTYPPLIDRIAQAIEALRLQFGQ